MDFMGLFFFFFSNKSIFSDPFAILYDFYLFLLSLIILYYQYFFMCIQTSLERPGNILSRSSNFPLWRLALCFVSYYKQLMININTFFFSLGTLPKLFETEKHSGSFIWIPMFLNSFKETSLSSAKKTRQLFLKTLYVSSFPSSSWDHLAVSQHQPTAWYRVLPGWPPPVFQRNVFFNTGKCHLLHPWPLVLAASRLSKRLRMIQQVTFQQFYCVFFVWTQCTLYGRHISNTFSFSCLSVLSYLLLFYLVVYVF